MHGELSYRNVWKITDQAQTAKNGDLMSCLICAGSADRIKCDGPWEERDCPTCGRYRVSDVLVLTLMEQGQIFDVSKTRIWLARKRKEIAIPSIEIHEALLVP
ncbi:hypothetical protein [Pseudomonas fluorescens]|uniref:hypothetical protein n=1 Tax=Pseudomonas fluorescens TaxID=294 RepID=UPI001E5C9AF1|nr:hypothetical protein [Pseudomonas fluorescens]